MLQPDCCPELHCCYQARHHAAAECDNGFAQAMLSLLDRPKGLHITSQAGTELPSAVKTAQVLVVYTVSICDYVSFRE